jgi:hypothetical protein
MQSSIIPPTSSSFPGLDAMRSISEMDPRAEAYVIECDPRRLALSPSWSPLDSGSTGSLDPAAPAVERDETVSRNWCSRAARSSRAPPEARINQSHVGSRLSPSWSPLDSGSTGSLDPAAPAVERDETPSYNWCSRAPARAERHQRRGSTSPTLGRALTAGRARTTRRRTHASLARPSTPYGAVRPARTASGKQAGGEGWFDDVHAAGVACLPLA